jgi:hypothetical protein
MTSFTKVELPADVVAALKEKMASVAAAFDAPVPELSDTPAGRDILHAVSALGPNLSSRWARFDALLGAEVFTPRMYNFRQTGKANKARWAPRRVTVASRDFLSGNPAKLRDLFNQLGAREENNYVNIWVWPAPDKGPGIFFALVHHKDGTEAAFSVTPSGWQHIKVPAPAIDIILMDLLALDRHMKDHWVALLSHGAAHADEELRDELMPLLTQWGMPNITEEQWREFLQVVFLRQGYLDCIIEAGRHLSTPLMHEAQNLLEALASHTAEAQETLDRRVAQLDREHSRALKRARADLDKANMCLNGAHARNRSLAKEIALLQEQARAHQVLAHSAGTVAEAAEADADDVSLAVALDQFFD